MCHYEMALIEFVILQSLWFGKIRNLNKKNGRRKKAQSQTMVWGKNALQISQPDRMLSQKPKEKTRPTHSGKMLYPNDCKMI